MSLRWVLQGSSCGAAIKDLNMPTEKDVIEWIGVNWPSIVMTAFLTKSYLKIREFPIRLKRLEERVERVFEVCSGMHPDKAVFLFKEKEEK